MKESKSELVRFHEWVIDKNKISLVQIKTKDGKQYNDFDEIEHLVVISMNNSQTLTLSCHNKYYALRELDYLTAKIDPILLGSETNTYLVNQVYLTRSFVSDLITEVKKLMKSYKKIKDK